MTPDDPWLKALLERVDAHCTRVEEKVEDFIKDVQEHYVTKTELSPIKIIVFGMAAIILGAFATMLVIKIGWK